MKEETVLELLRIAAGLAQAAAGDRETKFPSKTINGGMDITVVFVDCVKSVHAQYLALRAQQPAEHGIGLERPE